MAANAFVNPSSTSSLTQQQRVQTTPTILSLLPPIEPAIESASLLTAMDGSVVDTLGSLALLGSVGFGVFMGKSNNPDWSYEYNPKNDAFSGDGDLALLEESPGSVLEKVSIYVSVEDICFELNCNSRLIGSHSCSIKLR